MEWTHAQTIDAPPDVVWQLTTGVNDWPTYMPTVQSLERLDAGPLRVGSQAKIKQPGQRTAIWTVTSLTEGARFSWRSERRFITLTGTHTVAPEGQGTRNVLTIEMSGPLSPVLGRLLGPAMRRVLRTENSCFAAQAEQRAATKA